MSKVKLNNVRIAFIQNLWEPKEFKAGDGRFRRGATYIFEKDGDNDKAVKAEINKVSTAAWGTNAAKILKTISSDKLKFCYTFEKASKEGDVFEGFEGMMSISGNRAVEKGPILVLDEDGRTTISSDSGKLYGGCYVNATVDIWAQTGEFGPAVRCTPIGVQFVKEGDAFSGAPPASLDDFEDLTSGADAGDFADVSEEEDTREKDDPLAGLL